MKRYISYTISELLSMNKEFTKKIDVLNYQLEQLISVNEEISRIVNKYNKETDLKTNVLIPSDLIEGLRKKGRAVIGIVNWKTLVIDTIKEYDSFFTTERIYLINRIKYPSEFSEKSKAIRNISAALRYLFLEKKIGRYKDSKGKYNYGIYERHFDNKGKPLEEFIKKEKQLP